MEHNMSDTDDEMRIWTRQLFSIAETDQTQAADEPPPTPPPAGPVVPREGTNPSCNPDTSGMRAFVRNLFNYTD